jgi:hypothetical protein
MKRIILFLIAILCFISVQHSYAQCDYSLEMNDIFGDGWNGNTMDVLVNGIVVLDDATLNAGYQNTLSFPVNSGDDITTIWNGGGQTPWETSFRILNNDGAEVGAGDYDSNFTSGTITAFCSGCPAPSGLTAMDITITGANLGWTEGGTAMIWDLEIGVSGFSPTGIPTDNDVNANPFTWSGGSSHTSYDFYVRADCGVEQSNWIGPFTFTTLPTCDDTWFDTGGAGEDYGDDEDIQITVCPDSGGEVITATFASFNTESGFDGMVIYNGNSVMDPIFSSGLPEGEDPVTCPAGSYYGTTSPGTVTSTAANGCLTFWFRSDGATVASGWEATFTCTPNPVCLPPSPLTVTVITSTGANLGWGENGSATTWDLEIGIEGFSPTGSPTINNVTTNPYTWAGGLSNTSYDFYVRADCAADGGSGQSIWAGPFTFTTLLGCGDTWYDTGGIAGEYSKNEDIQVTVCPTVGDEVVTAVFASFETESGFDGMVVYNGNSTASPIISSGLGEGDDATNCPAGSYYGTTSPGTITSSSPDGCLTFWFRSDGLTNAPGWEVIFACTGSPDCPTPFTLTTSSITAIGADLGWTENGSATFWDIEIGTEGFSPNGTPTIENVPSNPFTWDQGDYATSYDFYVRADCAAGSGIGQSNWAGPFTFTTICGVYTPDYAELFSTFIPKCWEVGEGPVAGPDSTGTSGWKADGFANDGDVGAAKFNLWNADDADWLISPAFDLTGGGFVLNVDVAVTGNSNTDPSLMGSDDQVLLMQSIDGGNTWTTINTWDIVNTPSNVGETIIFDITAITSNNTVFAFFANEGSIDDPEDYDFFIDNFKIQPPPPENNNLCNATPLILGAACTVDTYTNVYATAETNEPSGNCFTELSNSVWFSFAAPASGRVTVTTDILPGDIGDTEIAVYGEGFNFDCADLSTLSSQEGCDQDGGTVVDSSRMSVLTLNCLTPGSFYYIQVDGGTDSIGRFCIEVVDEGFFTIPPATSTLIKSDSICVDGIWSHYYNAVNNQILLSLKIGSTGAIVLKNQVVVDADGGTDVFWVPSVPGNLVDNGVGAAFMKRKWTVTPTTPPIGVVGVRFYYTDQEFDAINTEIINQTGIPLTDHTGLRFFKTTNGSDPFGVGSLLKPDGIELSHGTPSTTSWQHGTYNGEHYAEFLVEDFNGGGGGAGVSGSNGLPVELLSFSGKAMDQYNIIKWVTASELNTEIHIIERSPDGIKGFEIVGQLPAAGNSFEQRSYQMRDNAPLQTGFYRLKTVDFDGGYQFSKIINIERKDGKETLLKVYPNPVKKELTVQFYTDSPQTVNCNLTNVVGKVIFENNFISKKGLNEEVIDVENIEAGLYFLTYESGGLRIIKRLVKE